MRPLSRAVAALFFTLIVGALAADDTDLTPANVHLIRELWHRDLTTNASAPRLLGPIITHRGIKELAIVSDGNTVEAIDADLGRVFWSKRIGTEPACAPYPPAPAIANVRPLEPGQEAAPPTQAIYVVSNDGLLHVLRPADGEDIRTPKPYMPPKAQAEDLSVLEKSVGTTWKTCNGTQSGFSMAPTPNGKAPVKAPANLRVTANGVEFFLDGQGLHALNAKTGEQLYLTSAAAEARPNSLTVATGHVCFTAGRRVSCYGLPIEMQ